MFELKFFQSQSLVVGALILVVVSCDNGDGIVTLPDQENDRVQITNSEGLLQARVTYPGTAVTIDPPPQGSFPANVLLGPERAKPGGFSLSLEAEVAPPLVDGQIVQATSVSLEIGFKAMVSYNMRGGPRLGGMDWITRLNSSPRISSSATFNDSDISAVSFDGTHAYAAEATNAQDFPFPAVLERLKLEGNNFTLEQNLRVPLTSYVATSTLVTSNHVYTTSGDGGHVAGFDQSSLTLQGEYPLDDARWVAWDQAGQRIVVAQGTPGRIAVFAEGEFPGGSMNLLNTFPFPGADVPESKSTV